MNKSNHRKTFRNIQIERRELKYVVTEGQDFTDPGIRDRMMQLSIYSLETQGEIPENF